jgi:hypothetical protein
MARCLESEPAAIRPSCRAQPTQPHGRRTFPRNLRGGSQPNAGSRATLSVGPQCQLEFQGEGGPNAPEGIESVYRYQKVQICPRDHPDSLRGTCGLISRTLRGMCSQRCRVPREGIHAAVRKASIRNPLLLLDPCRTPAEPLRLPEARALPSRSRTSCKRRFSHA